jgi:hypothetical protein
MIVVWTDHSRLRVGCHSWYQSHYGYNTSRTVLFSKTYGEDTLRSRHMNYSSLNRRQANKDLLSVLTFCNLLFTMTHLRQGKKVTILMPNDVNSGPVASRQGLLEAVPIVR